MSSPDWERAIEADDLEGVRALVEREPERLRRPVTGGISPLLYALYNRASAVAGWLRENTGDLDVFEAAALGETEALTNLLQGERELVNAHGPDGFTPLHLACFFARPQAVRLLLRFGADADAEARNPVRVTPLHSAAASRDAHTVSALLDGGPDVDARQAGGFTALHAAAMHGNEAMTRALLEAGADPAVRDDGGRDAAAFAREGGFADLAVRLDPT